MDNQIFIEHGYFDKSDKSDRLDNFNFVFIIHIDLIRNKFN